MTRELIASRSKEDNLVNTAICSQWQNACGEQNGQLIDGIFVKNPALAVNAAHQQRLAWQNTTLTPLKALIAK